MKWMKKAAIISSFVAGIITSLIISVPVRVESATLESVETKLAYIESINSIGEDNSAELVIKLSTPATYTSYKTASPLRLVIDLSQTTTGAIISPIMVNKGNFKTVTVSKFDTDAGVLTRIDIELDRDIEALLSASPDNPGELRVSFPTIVADKVSVPEVPPETLKPVIVDSSAAINPQINVSSTSDTKKATARLTSITAQDNTILLSLDGAITSYNAFRLNKPERFVIDLMEVQSSLLTRLLPLNSAGVASARIGIYPEKLRVVFDTVHEAFPEARAEKTDAGILITLGKKSENGNIKLTPALEKNTAETPVKVPAEIPEKAPAKAPAEVLPKAPAEVLKKAPAEAPLKAPAKASPAVPAATHAKASAETPAGVPVITPAENSAIKVKRVLAPVVPSVFQNESPNVENEPVEKRTIKPIKKIKSNLSATVEMVDFQVVDGISRVSVKVSGEISVSQPIKSPGFITLTIKNSNLPKKLQRSLEAQAFVSPVLRVTPLMVKGKTGTDTKICIAMRSTVPFEMRQEGDMLYVDIKNPDGLTAEKLAIETTDGKQKAGRSSASRNGADELSSEFAPSTEMPVKQVETGHGYKGRKVTLEFADAEVRKIFQLLSEVSNKNFVLGDDVTGAISIKLVNVPWDQALDIILDTKGLDKREDGNIILIKGKGKFKSQAEEEQEIKKALTKAIELKTETFSINYADIGTIAGQFNGLRSERGTISQDARTNKVIVKDIPQNLDDMRKLLVQLDVPEKQVMIEARIVEASSSFTRNLGVNWGVHYRDGSASFFGINSLDTAFGGLTSAPPTTGTGSGSGGSMGISFGTLSSNIQLDMRLNAAASAGMVKIVSTPKVATLNNKTAKITQGQQIPYTSSTSDKVETKFIEAALSLEVTPHINANGTIGMKIDAKNDSPGQSTGSSAPPINKKQATTEMLLRDGETTVIGGIYVDSDNTSDDGVPYLMDIPLLGKLFKTNNTTKTKTELLIFITPRILGTI